MLREFFAAETQAKKHRHDVILCAASECRMWVSAGSFLQGEEVSPVLKGRE